LRPTIGIIGAGKVGSTLARLLYKTGYEITAVYSRTPEKVRALAEKTDATIANQLSDVVKNANLILLTVSDDAIETIATELASCDWQGRAIVHTSGAAGIEKLQSLADASAMVGSLHPAFPFADVESAMEKLAGASFAVEAPDGQLKIWLQDIVVALDGQVILIPEGKKALYHAALVIASNYTVTLYAIAQQMLKNLDADSEAIDNALTTLVQATVENIASQGIPDALTGPLSRADTGTIQSHLAAIDDYTLATAYIALARLSFPMLQQRGINTHLIEKLLQDSHNETSHDS